MPCHVPRGLRALPYARPWCGHRPRRSGDYTPAPRAPSPHRPPVPQLGARASHLPSNRDDTGWISYEETALVTHHDGETQILSIRDTPLATALELHADDEAELGSVQTVVIPIPLPDVPRTTGSAAKSTTACTSRSPRAGGRTTSPPRGTSRRSVTPIALPTDRREQRLRPGALRRSVWPDSEEADAVLALRALRDTHIRPGVADTEKNAAHTTALTALSCFHNSLEQLATPNPAPDA